MTHAMAVPGAGAVSPPESTWDADTALTNLYAAHWRQLVRLSVLLVRDVATAEEVVQDAFVAVHDRWSRLRDPDKALAYLRQTVVNRSRSALRHRAVVHRHVQATGSAPPVDLPGSDETAVAAERRDRVLTALQALPARQREVMALRYYAGLSEAEIADALGISRGAVKSHAFRGAAALRASLTDYLEDRS
jgi:RNA polymerase sigma-70 factor (sigma-E family)